MQHTRKIENTAGTGLVLLTLIGLVATPAAHAQTLYLGQYPSTTLSGTATLTDTGTTASGIYTYSDRNTGVALTNQNSYTYWQADGPSTANVDGGTITNLITYDTSTVNVNGGKIGNFSPSGTSTANISGGSIGALTTYEVSTANVTGGSISDYLSTSGTSTLNVSGGSVNDLLTRDTSTINISGGNISGYLDADFSGTVNVSGGNISGLVSTINNGVLDLFGTGLTATFEFSGSNYKQYNLTGTLADGDALNASYDDYGGPLEFNGVPVAVPEASTTVSLGLLLGLGMGGLVIAAKRKKAFASP